LLPAHTLERLDESLAPHVPQAADWDEVPAGEWVAFPVDLRLLIDVSESLTDAQLRHGGRLVYEDPSHPYGAYRHALREAVLQEAARDVDFFRLLASFTPDQWRMAQRDGVTCDRLTEEQLRRLQRLLVTRGVKLEKEPLRAWRVRAHVEMWERAAHRVLPADDSGLPPIASGRAHLTAAVENDFAWDEPDDLDLADALPWWRPGPRWEPVYRWQFSYRSGVRVERPHPAVLSPEGIGSQ
jgi:hypothetical protein